MDSLSSLVRVGLLISLLSIVLGEKNLRQNWALQRSRPLWPWPWPWQPTSAPPIVIPTVTPFKYPFYTQCDPKWSSMIMQHDDICKVGCFLTSISMALAGRGIKIPKGIVANPRTLNSWLRNQTNPAGYLPVDILNTPVLTNISPKIAIGTDYMHRTNDLKASDVVSLMQNGKVVIANVHSGKHFVLLTGFPKTGPYSNFTVFAAQDPAKFATGYSHNQIAGFRIFTM